MRIAGTVILYNPNKKVLENIATYVNQLEKLYVVDNSTKKNDWLICEICKYKQVVYIDNKKNCGIAYALNMGLSKAINDRIEWLLTMDQDSKPDKDMLQIMLDYIDNNVTENIGILAAKPIEFFEKKKMSSGKKKHITIAMTSGSLMNLNNCKKVGKFMNNLFIDEVDIEYCLRIKKNGYEMIELEDAYLCHNRGKQKKVGGVTCFHYPAIRYFYITRNSLIVANMYKEKFPSYCRGLREEIYSIWLQSAIRGKHVLKSLLFMSWGIVQYFFIELVIRCKKH